MENRMRRSVAEAAKTAVVLTIQGAAGAFDAVRCRSIGVRNGKLLFERFSNALYNHLRRIKFRRSSTIFPKIF